MGGKKSGGRNRCVVPGCNVKSGDGIALFGFPRVSHEPQRYLAWIRILGIDESRVNATACVCRLHFDEDHVLDRPNCLGRLVPGSIPIPPYASAVAERTPVTSEQATWIRAPPASASGVMLAPPPRVRIIRPTSGAEVAVGLRTIGPASAAKVAPGVRTIGPTTSASTSVANVAKRVRTIGPAPATKVAKRVRSIGPASSSKPAATVAKKRCRTTVAASTSTSAANKAKRLQTIVPPASTSSSSAVMIAPLVPTNIATSTSSSALTVAPPVSIVDTPLTSSSAVFDAPLLLNNFAPSGSSSAVVAPLLPRNVALSGSSSELVAPVLPINVSLSGSSLPAVAPLLPRNVAPFGSSTVAPLLPRNVAPSGSSSAVVAPLLPTDFAPSTSSSRRRVVTMDIDPTADPNPIDVSLASAPQTSEQVPKLVLPPVLISSPKQPAFIVDAAHLRALFRRCPECGVHIEKQVRFHTLGAHLRVDYFCDGWCKREISWHSFDFVDGSSRINLALPAATVTSGRTFEDLSQIADGCDLVVPSKTEFNDVVRAYVHPAIRKTYESANAELMKEIRAEHQQNPTDTGALEIAVDSRYYGTSSNSGSADSHFATTSAFDIKRKKIVAVSLSSITTMPENTADAVVSGARSQLDINGTKIMLDALIKGGADGGSSTTAEGGTTSEVGPSTSGGVRVGVLVTKDEEQASVTTKMLKEEYAHIRHRDDIVEQFIKRVEKYLIAKSNKTASCAGALLPWIKPIANLIRTICKECKGDLDLLEEMWRSIGNHVKGIHSWQPSDTFKRLHSCLHEPVAPAPKSQWGGRVAWLAKSSLAYNGVAKILNDPNLISSLRQCGRCVNYSSELMDGFYSTLTEKFLPPHERRYSLSTDAFMARIFMAILHFNENSVSCRQSSGTEGDDAAPVLQQDDDDADHNYDVPVVGPNGETEHTFNWRHSIVKRVLDLGGHRASSQPQQPAPGKRPPFRIIRAKLKRPRYRRRLIVSIEPHTERAGLRK